MFTECTILCFVHSAPQTSHNTFNCYKIEHCTQYNSLCTVTHSVQHNLEYYAIVQNPIMVMT